MVGFRRIHAILLGEAEMAEISNVLRVVRVFCLRLILVSSSTAITAATSCNLPSEGINQFISKIIGTKTSANYYGTSPSDHHACAASAY